MTGSLRGSLRLFQGIGRVLFWVTLLAVFLLSQLPISSLPDSVTGIWDKSQHAFGFLVLTLFV